MEQGSGEEEEGRGGGGGGAVRLRVPVLERPRADRPALRVAVLEIGCGDRVPTIRRITEDLVADVTGAGGVATLVRVNPDFPDADRSDVVHRCVPVASRGLAAVKAIDALLPGGELGGASCSPQAAAAADASVRSAISSLTQNATATSPRRVPVMTPTGGRFATGGGAGFQHPAYDDEEEEDEQEEEEEEEGSGGGAEPARLFTGEASDEEEEVDFAELPEPMSLGSNADPQHWQELERCLCDAVASQSVSPRPSCTGCDLASRRSSLSGADVPSAVLGSSGIRSG